MHGRLGQQRIVLNLRLADGRAVVGDNHHFSLQGKQKWREIRHGYHKHEIEGEKRGETMVYLATAQSLKGGLVSQSILSRFHHKRQTRVDVFLVLLGFLGGHHDE